MNNSEQWDAEKFKRIKLQKSQPIVVPSFLLISWLAYSLVISWLAVALGLILSFHVWAVLLGIGMLGLASYVWNEIAERNYD